MPNYRHMVRLPYTSGLPEDVAVNVFHSICDDNAEAVAFAEAIVTFYTTIDGTILSNQISAAADACSVTTYDLSQPEPRVPIDVNTFTLVPSGSSIPNEIALCLSFEGAPLPGSDPARRRGRVFLGPLGGINDSTTSRPQAARIAEVQAAAQALLDNATGAAWAVYSTVDAQTVPVASGWIDNEYDTMRSRGRKATTRATFS